MRMPQITYESRIVLVPLTIHENKRNIIVEDVFAREYYEMSPASVDAIRALQEGMPLHEVEAQLKERYPDEEIDMIEFVSALLELELVAEADGRTLREISDEEAVLAHNPDSWPNRLGRFLFRTPFILVYFAAIACWITLFITRPDLLPELHSMHMVESMTVNVIIWAGVSLGLLAMHEFSHFLAARSYDVSASYGFGHRLYFLVLETDISEVWKLPPRKRIIPYIAGMLNDSVMLSLTLIIRMVYPEMNDLLYEILELASLYLCVMLVFQTFVFMKTDLYYVLETALGALNLKERTHEWMKGLFRRRREKEVTAVKVYSFFYLAGLAFSVWLFFNVMIPQFLHFLEHGRDYLSYPVTDYYFWDGVLFLLLNGATLVLLFYSWMRKLLTIYYERTERMQKQAVESS